MKKNKKIAITSILGILSVAAIGAGLGAGLSAGAGSTSQQTAVQHQKLNSIPNITTHEKLLSSGLSNVGQQTNAATTNVTVNNVVYALNLSQFTASANGFAVANNQKTLTIPTQIIYKGIPFAVTSVSNGAFYNTMLEQINLPNGLLFIGACAFANNFLTTLTIPESVLNIGDNAFSNNPFNYDTVVRLGPNCQWNKTTQWCPFPNSHNYSKLAPQVSFVIQNQAVYQWQPNQQGWVVTSYMPSIGNVNIPGYKLQKQYNGSALKFDANYKQYPYKRSQTINTHINDFMFSKSLATNLVKVGDTNAALYFNPQTMTVQFLYQGKSSNQLVGSGDNGSFSLYSPTENGFNANTNLQAGTTYSQFNTLLGSNTKFHYGDIISFQGNLAKNIWIFTQYNGDLNILNNTWNCLYNGSYTWTTVNVALDIKFMITPYGLIPYTNIIKFNPLQVLTSTNQTSFNVTGTTMPNRKVSVTVNNTTYTGTSNANGEFNVLVTNQPSNIDTVVSIGVAGVQPVLAHLLGDNPVNGAILLQVNGLDLSLLFNGIFHKIQVYYQGSFNSSHFLRYPSFTNPNFIYNNFPNLGSTSYNTAMSRTIGSFSNSKAANWNFTINTQKAVVQNGVTTYETVKSYSITAEPSTTVNDLINQLQNIHYKNGIIYQFVFPNSQTSVAQILNNGVETQMGITQKGSVTYNQFMVDKSGVINLLNTPAEINDVNQNNEYYEPYKINYRANNHSLISFAHFGYIEAGNGDNNFYDPSPLMKQVAEGLTMGVQTDYEKALAIFRFVGDNMQYTEKYTYGHTIQGTFKHFEGVCGNYANLTAVMCSTVGIVARVIAGDAYLQANPWATYPIDHGWDQIWSPRLKVWLTLDPTFGWDGPYGQVQNQFNFIRGSEQMSVVFWPKGTNYFSYFKGAEWEALNHLAGYFDVGAGHGAVKFTVSTAINIVKILQPAQYLQPDYYYTYSKEN